MFTKLTYDYISQKSHTCGGCDKNVIKGTVEIRMPQFSKDNDKGFHIPCAIESLQNSLSELSKIKLRKLPAV